MREFFRALVVGLLFAGFTACEAEKADTSENNGQTPEVTELPQVSINTLGETIVDEPKIAATLTISDNGTADFSGKIGIEIRGSSSQMFPKKQYGLEIWDDANDGIDASLLGLPEEEDWILYAPYSDKSLIRNALIYDLSRDIGRYASRVLFVEVYLNDQYDGVYVLMEKLKRNSNRIAIDKLKPEEVSGEELTGGYILKIDKADGPNETVYTDATAIASAYPPNYSEAGSIYFLYDTPKAEDLAPEQRAYIADYMHQFEDALAGDNFADPEAGYAQYIDVDSFIDFFLLTELSNNVDGYRLSTWLTKDLNQKLHMGPIWDFNLAFGNADYCSGGNTDVWAYQFNSRCPGDIWMVPFWWERLMQDPAFVAKVQSRWQELRGGPFSNPAIMGKIDAYVARLTQPGAAAENFERWPVLGEYVWPNNYVGASYGDEIQYLKDWINSRLSWLDQAVMEL